MSPETTTSTEEMLDSCPACDAPVHLNADGRPQCERGHIIIRPRRVVPTPGPGLEREDELPPPPTRPSSEEVTEAWIEEQFRKQGKALERIKGLAGFVGPADAQELSDDGNEDQTPEPESEDAAPSGGELDFEPVVLPKGEFALWLKQARGTRGVTQKQLAKISGLHFQTLSKIERGEYIAPPATQVLLRLLLRLDLAVIRRALL